MDPLQPIEAVFFYFMCSMLCLFAAYGLRGFIFAMLVFCIISLISFGMSLLYMHRCFNANKK